MQFYQLFMFLHVACVIVWLGCATSLSIRTFAALRAGDDDAAMGIIHDASTIFDKVFGAAAGGALVCGLVMTWLAWDFRELWIDIGLAGFAASGFVGAFVLSARKKRLQEISARDGVRSETAFREARQLLVLAQLDTLFLWVVVADMVLKPQIDSFPTLATMAAAIVLGIIAIVRRVRSFADEGI